MDLPGLDLCSSRIRQQHLLCQTLFQGSSHSSTCVPCLCIAEYQMVTCKSTAPAALVITMGVARCCGGEQNPQAPSLCPAFSPRATVAWHVLGLFRGSVQFLSHIPRSQVGGLRCATQEGQKLPTGSVYVERHFLVLISSALAKCLPSLWITSDVNLAPFLSGSLLSPEKTAKATEHESVVPEQLRVSALCSYKVNQRPRAWLWP